MKKTVVLTVLCFVAAIMMLPQIVQSQDSAAILKEFTRSGKIEGITLSFTHLNNKTIEVLFSGPSKYAIRAKANQATAFYVQGEPEKNLTLDSTFVIEQDGQTFGCSAVDIQNFAGGSVSKGKMVKGILQLDKKLDFTHPFKVKNAATSFDLNMSEAAKDM